MRGEMWASLVVCLIGAVIPLAWIGRHLTGRFGLLAAGVAVIPFVMVAGTAWAARQDRWAARVVVVVAVLMLAVALGGWWWALRERDVFALVLAGLLFVPEAQVLIWLGGAVVAGRRGRA